MFENIETILNEQCGLVKDRIVIAGVSGGPDSLCLLGILRDAGYRVIVAHFNHKLRLDSDVDANVVEKAASSMNFASVIESGDVSEYASQEKLSLEDAARKMRYRFLMAQARKFKAQAVAVGHTAEDQAETVLMHFLRGAGLAGLKGMPYRTMLPMFDPNIPVVRPLLDVWREETVVYCAARGLRPQYDASNDSLDFFRNRVRNMLIPSLESYNPRIKDVLLRTSRSLAGDYEIINGLVNDAWQACVVHETTKYISFDMSFIIKQPLGLQRHLLRRAIELIHPEGFDVDFATLERATSFIANGKGSRMDLTGGLHLLREGYLIYVVSGSATLPVERWPQMPVDSQTIPLRIPSSMTLSGGWKLTCERWDRPTLALEQARANDNPYQVWVDANGISDALELRARQDGDRFEPLGMEGHEIKISDFFINNKLPQRARDRFPLLCMGEKVIWVPGYRPAHSFRLTGETRQALYFSMTNDSKK